MPEHAATPSVEPLLRGAARLGVLLGALELPWERVAPLVAAFPAELRDDLELGVSSHGPPLWLRTRGDGKAYTFRVARFLEERGVPEGALRRLLVTAEHAHHRHLLLEVGADTSGLSTFGWTARRPFTLEEGRSWLAAAEADADALARVTLVSQALERAQIHALGERTGPAGTVQRVTWAQEAEGAAWPRLEQAAHRSGLSPATWAALEARMPLLAGAGSRFTLERAGAALAVEVDLDSVDGATVAQALVGPAAESLRLLLELAQRPHLDRATFRLVEGQAMAVTGWARTATPGGG